MTSQHRTSFIFIIVRRVSFRETGALSPTPGWWKVEQGEVLGRAGYRPRFLLLRLPRFKLTKHLVLHKRS